MVCYGMIEETNFKRNFMEKKESYGIIIIQEFIKAYILKIKSKHCDSWL